MPPRFSPMLEDAASGAAQGLGGEAIAGHRYHLIGVGGSGMRGLAAMLLARGGIVTGSDRQASDALDGLIESGADIRIGQSADHLPDDVQTVVASAAIAEVNPELKAARALQTTRGVRVLKYADMLGRVMAMHDGIAVAGTHGKSTTSALIAYMLQLADMKPSYIIGAAVEQLGGSSGCGVGKHFVAEACEYDRSFLNLQPRFATILNVEEDHLDCYVDLAEIVAAFNAFASRLPRNGVLIVNGDSRPARQAAEGISATVETFGEGSHNAWRIVDLQARRGRFHGRILHRDEPVKRVTVNLPGRHNVSNALAAWAIGHHAGVPVDAMAEAVATFRGARRRLEFKGEGKGVIVVDDYAHHPTEISTTLRAARDFYAPKRLVCVFQPHQHSRTRHLLEQFARSFTAADLILLPDIYFVRDSEQEKAAVSSEDLVSRISQLGGDAEYRATLPQLVSRLKDVLRAGDLVITMGAGDIDTVADELAAWLQ